MKELLERLWNEHNYESTAAIAHDFELEVSTIQAWAETTFEVVNTLAQAKLTEALKIFVKRSPELAKEAVQALTRTKPQEAARIMQNHNLNPEAFPQLIRSLSYSSLLYFIKTGEFGILYTLEIIRDKSDMLETVIQILTKSKEPWALPLAAQVFHQNRGIFLPKPVFLKIKSARPRHSSLGPRTTR